MTHPTNVLNNPTKFFRANFSSEFRPVRTGLNICLQRANDKEKGQRRLHAKHDSLELLRDDYASSAFFHHDANDGVNGLSSMNVKSVNDVILETKKRYQSRDCFLRSFGTNASCCTHIRMYSFTFLFDKNINMLKRRQGVMGKGAR
jgi:hypothetical protein